MTSLVEFMIFETTETSTQNTQNTFLLRNMLLVFSARRRERHEPTYHNGWLLPVAGIMMGADWLEPLERARAFREDYLTLAPATNHQSCLMSDGSTESGRRCDFQVADDNCTLFSSRRFLPSAAVALSVPKHER